MSTWCWAGGTDTPDTASLAALQDSGQQSASPALDNIKKIFLPNGSSFCSKIPTLRTQKAPQINLKRHSAVKQELERSRRRFVVTEAECVQLGSRFQTLAVSFNTGFNPSVLVTI